MDAEIEEKSEWKKMNKRDDITLGEICNTLRGVWGEYVAQGF